MWSWYEHYHAWWPLQTFSVLTALARSWKFTSCVLFAASLTPLSLLKSGMANFRLPLKVSGRACVVGLGCVQPNKMLFPAQKGCRQGNTVGAHAAHIIAVPPRSGGGGGGRTHEIHRYTDPMHRYAGFLFSPASSCDQILPGLRPR